MNKLLYGDCLELLKEIPNESVDAVITDPPYSCLNKSNPHATWDKAFDMDAWWKEIWRVCKRDAAVVCFGQGLFSARLMLSQERNYRYSLVWDKCRATGFLNANRMPLRYHEDLLVFYRALPTYNPQMEDLNGRERNHPQGYGEHREYNRCYGNIRRITPQIFDKKHPRSIIKIPKEHGCKVHALHPTQKPIALMEYLIKTYTNEGYVVLDPFMGSGSTGVACVNTCRDFIGIELTKEYFEIAKKRIHDAEIDKMQRLDL